MKHADIMQAYEWAKKRNDLLIHREQLSESNVSRVEFYKINDGILEKGVQFNYIETKTIHEAVKEAAIKYLDAEIKECDAALNRLGVSLT